MRGKLRNVVPHRAARGRFDEVTLELAVETLADDAGQRLECVRQNRRRLTPGLRDLLCAGIARGGATAKDGLPRRPDVFLRGVVLTQCCDSGLDSGRDLLSNAIARADGAVVRLDGGFGFGALEFGSFLLDATAEIFLLASCEG
jgi:hypothetical protein